MAHATPAHDPADDETQALAEVMDRIDNTLCHLGRDDPRFDRFEALAEEIGTAFGGDAIRWKRHVATDATSTDDEAKIAYNIAQILEAAERLPSKWRQPILKAMDEAVKSTELSAANEDTSEEVLDRLAPTIPVKVGQQMKPRGYLDHLRGKLTEGYIDYPEVEIKVTYSAFSRDEEEVKEVVEERVMEELLAIREVEAFELKDAYQTAEAEASDLLGVLEYRVALAS